MIIFRPLRGDPPHGVASIPSCWRNLAAAATRASLFAAVLALGIVAAADDRIEVGTATEDITPDPAILNWVTGRPFGSVRDPLTVQALVLDDGTAQVALVRWDLVDVSESARDAVRKAISESTGIPASHVMVHASHTHSAPWAPVYGDNGRGKERETWWDIRRMKSQQDEPRYLQWKKQVLAAATRAVERAIASKQSAVMTVGRVSVGEYLYNRRPRIPAWGLADPKAPTRMVSGRGEWIPEVLLAGGSFGPIDRAMTVLAFRDASRKISNALIHVACHPVQLYHEDANRISADWPGFLVEELRGLATGELVVLQGCAGDITPAWAKGVAATQIAMRAWAEKVKLALRFSADLVPGKLLVDATTIELPLTEEAQGRLGQKTVRAEVQAIVCGPVALIALPGEPLTDIGTAIRESSPFPQTIVLGYSNGNGVHYVGLPGEKARGGYEAGRAGAGADECGQLLVDAALATLHRLAVKAGVPVSATAPMPAAAAQRLDRANLLEYRAGDGSIVPVRSIADWQKRRAEILRGFQEVAGPFPGPEKRVPLDVRVEQETDFGRYVRRLITYAAEPGSRVPAHLYIPKQCLAPNSNSRARAVLCLMGTGGYRHRDGVGENLTVNTHDGEALAERGFVAIAPAAIFLGMGSRSGLDIPYRPNLEQLGYESGTMKTIWDNVRALDVLDSLPFVKKGAYGVIGHSYGGHNSIFTALFDDRIRTVVSSCGFDSFLDYRPNRWNPGEGWSQSIYLPKITTYARDEIPFDFHELIGALAPRPVLINAPVGDANFKWRSVARIVASASRVYSLYGVSRLLRVEHPDVDHVFPPDVRKIAYSCFEAHL